MPLTELTPYHARYFAHEITKRSPSDDINKLAASLANAQVDLNPHQIDAAIFAFRSPLSKGAILADEVGLGKTIEAGILLAQKWAERKRRLLVVVPANLRKQWSQELADKFFLPSSILEAKSFRECIEGGNLNPLAQPNIVICSYHFARTKEAYLRQVPWDLVIVDEAHRLRNVYKPNNRIANSIKSALAQAPKVLLTATPLQNSLLELYGLVSVIDDYAFGDLKSFRTQFCNPGNNNHAALRERLRPICQRTLRRQVVEYVRFTNRICITQEFFSTHEEQQLYDLVSEYLRRDNLYALPSSHRQLMTLIVRKLLASSTFAISGTLAALAKRLESEATENAPAAVTADPTGPVADDYEELDEVEDEWTDDDTETGSGVQYGPEDRELIRREIEELRRFESLALAISKNSKGQALLTALEQGFEKAKTLGATEKAIIFTESRRTQEYLRSLLEGGAYANRTVMFNGSNSDARSKEIYGAWLNRYQGTDRVTGSPSADMRAALVEHFRDDASIMIATEAAAEGINLQFCALVVNYDLPWNPQRVEQRIGRCHRYGQKYDVVVVNFVNKSNAADQRVYQLLREKFRLFDGVFGASDDVLGSIESGVDFEKRIAGIYQTCRSPAEIEAQFNALQSELEAEIDERMTETRRKLLENFDEEVQQKLRVGKQNAEEALNRFEQLLWQITRFALRDYASFDATNHSFHLAENPFPDETIALGTYSAGKEGGDAHLYRGGHSLALRVIEHCRNLDTPEAQLTFDLTGTGRNVGALDGLCGSAGWLEASLLTVTAFEVQDHLQLIACSDGGQILEQSQCERLFTLPCNVGSSVSCAGSLQDILGGERDRREKSVMTELSSKNARFLDEEIEKLDRWSDDQRSSLKQMLGELETDIREAKTLALKSTDPSEKLSLQRRRHDLEKKRDKEWLNYERAVKDIEAKKDSLLDDVEQRLNAEVHRERLFMVRWRLV